MTGPIILPKFSYSIERKKLSKKKKKILETKIKEYNIASVELELNGRQYNFKIHGDDIVSNGNIQMFSEEDLKNELENRGYNQGKVRIHLWSHEDMNETFNFNIYSEGKNLAHSWEYTGRPRSSIRPWLLVQGISKNILENTQVPEGLHEKSLDTIVQTPYESFRKGI